MGMDERHPKPDKLCVPEELSEMLPEVWVMVLKDCDGFEGTGER